MSVSRGTVHSIQFLRFVAATLVVAFHAHFGIVTRATGGASPGEMYLFEFGAVGVHIFFVISGYIMYLTNVARPHPFSPGLFFARRLIRIFPIYWIFVGLYLLVQTPLDLAPVLSPGRLGEALLLWPGEAAAVIGPAWTLSFELFFYFAFGLAMMLGARRGVWTLTIGFPLLVVAGFVLRPTLSIFQLATGSLLLEFVAGVWIARVTTMRKLPRSLGWSLIALTAGGYGAALMAGYDDYPTLLTLGLPSILLIAGAVILEQTGRRPHPLLSRTSVLGDSSYTLYLCHVLLISIAVEALRATGVTEGRLGLTLLVTIVSVVFAHLFHLAIERPLTTVLHRLLPRQRQRPENE